MFDCLQNTCFSPSSANRRNSLPEKDLAVAGNSDCFSATPPLRRQTWRGVTIIELLVVTTIIALLAAVTLPVIQIMQQRSREQRLHEILNDVRASIDGYQAITPVGPKYKKPKSAVGAIGQQMGYRAYVISQGWLKIKAANPPWGIQKKAFKVFLASGTEEGLFFPLCPTAMLAPMATPGFTIDVATDSSGGLVSISLNSRFLRHIPPHPFKSWKPNAHWEFKPAVSVAAGGPTYASSSTDPWNTQNATGVRNIYSRGAGIAIDGTDTDDW